MPTVGERIRELRNNAGISQGKLAREIGMPGKDSTLRMWELATTKPSMLSLMKLARFFNVSLDYLVGLTDLDDRKPVPVEELPIPIGALGDYRHLINELNLTMQQLKNNHSAVLVMVSDLIDRIRLLYLCNTVPKTLTVEADPDPDPEDESGAAYQKSRQEIIGKWLSGDLRFIHQNVIGPLESQLIEYVLLDYQKYLMKTERTVKQIMNAKKSGKAEGGATAKE